jgi:acetylornithine deacetylase/succinyl-diaminopimelate desuccinylase-like protein
VYERITTRPSLSVNGITAGYQGDGPKAVIPSKASAKLSFRLVQGQHPDHIETLFRNYIDAVTPACIKITVKKTASAKPVLVHPGHSYIRAAACAYEKVFHQKVKFIGSGGTIPVVNLLHENLSMPVIMMGFALPDDNPHGPNERFLLANFQKAIAVSICFITELGKK